jgi:hypothetical protein
MTDSPMTPPPTGAEQRVTPPVLDEGTYDRLREPRGSGRLELDGTWHQISPRYVASQFVQNGIMLALLVIVALVLAFVLHQSWVWIPAGILAAITLLTLAILPRQAKAIGYMLRADDIVFRKGILWQVRSIAPSASRSSRWSRPPRRRACRSPDSRRPPPRRCATR